jgi:hypothetical protein
VKPGRPSAGLALLSALVSVAASGVNAGATAVGLLGAVVLAGGVLRQWPTGVALGGLGLAGAIPLAATAEASAGALLLAAGGAALAYDLGEEGIETRRLFEGDTATVRGELAHAVGATVVVATAGGGAFVVYRAVSGQGSTLAVAALLAGATLLTAATRVK